MPICRNKEIAMTLADTKQPKAQSQSPRHHTTAKPVVFVDLARRALEGTKADEPLA